MKDLISRIEMQDKIKDLTKQNNFKGDYIFSLETKVDKLEKILSDYAVRIATLQIKLEDARDLLNEAVQD